MASSKKSEADSPQPIQTWALTLTKVQLLHLRDLLSVLLPPDGEQTVSQALAAGEQRTMAETKLWREVSALCRKAKLPLDKEAPDFVVMTTGAPTLDVIRIQDDLVAVVAAAEGQPALDGDPSGLFHEHEGPRHFHPGDNDDGGSPEPTPAPKKKPARKGKATKASRR